ncbi:MAG: PTS sugar transporter subunit IIA [Candidatus Omnitrophota bacterium]
MRVSDHLKEEFCVMELKAVDKKEAIKEITDKLSAAGKIRDLDKFISDVFEREALGSTGIGHGIAIPHARTNAVSDFIIGFGKSVNGVDFNSIDGQKVNLIFLMGADPSDLNHYLRLLAELSRLLMNSSFRRSLIAAETKEDVLKTIKDFENK